MSGGRTILADVSMHYGHARQRYEQAMRRGDHDRADDSMALMQEIERCVTVIEVSTSWRATVRQRDAREGRN